MRELPIHASASQVTSLESCAYAYYLERVLDGEHEQKQHPTVYLPGGTAFHAAIEYFEVQRSLGWRHEPSVSVTQELFTSEFDELVYRQRCESGIPEEEWGMAGGVEGVAFWEKRGREMVADYIAYRHREGYEIFEQGESVFGVELPVDCEIGGVKVKGYIDQVIVDREGRIGVVDLKTGKQPRESFQLGLYMRALEAQYGVKVDFARYYMARMGTHAGVLDSFWDYTLGEVETRLRRARDIKLAGEFPPTVGRQCSWCRVKSACEFGGTAEKGAVPLPTPMVRKETT